jgi:hypothetical protein
VLITIIFFGLIVHVNQPLSLANTAVLPYAPYHTAILHVPASALVDPNDSLIKDQQITKYDANEQEYLINLNGFSVQVEGTRGIFSGLKQELVDSEPPLHKLAPTCRLRTEVRNRTYVANDLVAYIDYRGGRLTPLNYYRDQLKFPDSSDVTLKNGICVNCKVKYEADLRDNTATLGFTDANGKEHDLVIKGNSTLTVTNLLQWRQRMNHFDYHYKVLTNCDPVHAEPGDLCGKDSCRPGANLLDAKVLFPDADCTNSHFP